MSDDSFIKISPSNQLREFICDRFKNSDEAPEGIKLICSPSVPLRKRGGKAELSVSLEKSSRSPYLCVNDLSWLNSQIRVLHEKGDESSGIYLHQLLEGCDIVLPQPPVIERNPVLEERIQRLKREQEAREYKAMTKNVDNVRVRHPDDSIGYQMKMLNSHLIAILQFVVSVGAGFTFGFMGIQLMVGSLDFGFRLLLGVACALTIALAEIYFLAKKLSEDYEDAPPFQLPKPTSTSPTVPSALQGKPHNE